MAILPEIESVARTGEYRFDPGQQAFQMDRRYEIGWYIQIRDNAPDWFYEPRLLLLDDRIPQYLDPYTSGTAGAPYSDPYALLRTGSITKVDRNRQRVDFTLIYSPIPLGDPNTLNSPLLEVFPTATPPTGGPSGGSGDPSGDLTQLAPKFTYTYETIDDIWETDQLGNKLVNTAVDPLDPLPTRPTAIRVLTTTRYEATWDETTWDSFNFVTNTFAWRGNTNESCLMFPPVVGDYVLLGGVMFYPVTYTIKIKIRDPFDWNLHIDSYGFRELVSGKQIPIVRSGNQVTKPWPLKITGAGLTEAEVASGSEPHALRFVKYPTNDFETLNLILPAP